MKKQAMTGLVVLALAVGMAALGTAQTSDDSETTDVEVSVSSTTSLDVKPDELNYTSKSIGARHTNSDRGFTTLQIENDGSNDIKEIWAKNWMPSSDPYGTGVNNNYRATNFFQIKARKSSAPYRGDTNQFMFINRVEYFETSSNTLVTTDDDGSWNGDSYSQYDIGRIRTGNEYSYFVLASDGSAGCDGSGSPSAQLRIGNVTSTPSNLGTYDFSDDNSNRYKDYNITTASNTGYGITQSAVNMSWLSGEWQEYDILTDCDGSQSLSNEGHVILTKYNVEAGGATDLQANDGNAASHIFRSTSSGSNDLNPGEFFSIDTAVQIPNGVPSGGTLKEGNVTVYAQAR